MNTQTRELSDEETVVKEAASLAPHQIYEVIRQEGMEELERPRRSLIWSGIAAGVMISLSVLGEAIFRTYLPQGSASYLIENVGYSLGFLAVILGRMQLFTENTITTVLPVVNSRSLTVFYSMIRLWSIVLTANVVGAFAVAGLYVFTPAVPADIFDSMVQLSYHATGMGTVDSFWRGIPAGIIVALIVWMMPQAESAKFFIILVFTWLIAAGDFTHIVAGSVEMAILMWMGELSVATAAVGFFLPVLAGNIIGGTVIFTLMAWGQVRDEIEAD